MLDNPKKLNFSRNNLTGVGFDPENKNTCKVNVFLLA